MSGRELHTAQQARKVVEQLRLEKNVPRGKSSTSMNEIVRFTVEMQKDDYLLNGFPTDKLNPYRPKNTIQCLVL